MGRGLLQGIKDLILDLGGGEADTDIEGTQIRDGVLPDAAVILPQLMSLPRGMSLQASSATILWAASSTAERPFSGALPE